MVELMRHQYRYIEKLLPEGRAREVAKRFVRSYINDKNDSSNLLDGLCTIYAAATDDGHTVDNITNVYGTFRKEMCEEYGCKPEQFDNCIKVLMNHEMKLLEKKKGDLEEIINRNNENV